MVGLALLLSGCAFYSFSGAAIPSHLQTIAIPLTIDNTTNPVGGLGTRLSDLLVDRFVNQTRLALTANENQADVVLNTRITQYNNQPATVSGDAQAAVNRVRITVEARYYDQVQDTARVAQDFSAFADYDPTTAGLDGERQAAVQALEQVADNIFSTATSNW